MNLETYINFTKRWEGGLSRDTNDSASSYPCPTPYQGKSGYHTNIGITYKVWVSVFGKNNDARFFAMNNEDWFKVFKSLYWDSVKGDDYKCFSIAVIVTGMAWGSGAHRASITLQQAINNCGGNVTVDGKIGMKTIAGANAINDLKLFNELIRLRKQFFLAISEVGTKNAKFRKGWLNRLADYEKTFKPA
jgi:lysozyme family protein